jgi:Electron transfer DM13
MKRRLAFALVIAAALGGLAAGLVVGRGHSANAQATPGVVAKGAFHSVTWNTTGTVSVVRQSNGQLRLRLSSDFTTKNAPELYVYLAKLRGQQKLYWKQVAPLKSSRGAQVYPVSSDAASTPGLEVAIYCGECNQINALAPLTQS